MCDKDRARLEKVLAGYPGVDAVDRFETLLTRDDVDAVAIATPVGPHAPLSRGGAARRQARPGRKAAGGLRP